MSQRLLEELVEAIARRAAEIVLDRLSAEQGSSQSASPYLSVAEAAAFLSTGPQRIYDLQSAGRLSRAKEGGRTLVLRAELEALVVLERRQRVASALPMDPRTLTASQLST